ncbi:MAG: hypothetical protein WDN76_01965 [Alphaproteobacteria bacterium]
MLLRNDAVPGWVNGTIGTIEALEPDAVILKVGRSSARVEPATWEKSRYEAGPRGGRKPQGNRHVPAIARCASAGR